MTSPLTLDHDGFFLGFPLSLNLGGSFSGLLFYRIYSITTPDGVYSGSFTILGGPNGGSANDLASAAFQVDVPEPGSILLLATGLLGLMGRNATGWRRWTSPLHQDRAAWTEASPPNSQSIWLKANLALVGGKPRATLQSPSG